MDDLIVKVTKQKVMDTYYNHNLRDTARLLGITVRALYELMERYGISKKGRGKQWKNKRRVQIVMEDPENSFIPKAYLKDGRVIPLKKEKMYCYIKDK
jgi:hypothetical protein